MSEQFELDISTLVEMFSGDDQPIEVEVVDDNEQIIPINGYNKVRFGIKENVEDTDYIVGPIDCDIATAGAQGIASVEVPAALTADISGTFVGEFEGEDSGGEITTFIQFQLDILKDVIV